MTVSLLVKIGLALSKNGDMTIYFKGEADLVAVLVGEL